MSRLESIRQREPRNVEIVMRLCMYAGPSFQPHGKFGVPENRVTLDSHGLVTIRDAISAVALRGCAIENIYSLLTGDLGARIDSVTRGRVEILVVDIQKRGQRMCI